MSRRFALAGTNSVEHAVTVGGNDGFDPGVSRCVVHLFYKYSSTGAIAGNFHCQHRVSIVSCMFDEAFQSQASREQGCRFEAEI